MDLSAYLVIADTGVYGHTREAIQVVQNKGKDALPFLHALGELTQQAEEAISQKMLKNWDKSSVKRIYI